MKKLETRIKDTRQKGERARESGVSSHGYQTITNRQKKKTSKLKRQLSSPLQLALSAHQKQKQNKPRRFERGVWYVQSNALKNGFSGRADSP